MILSVAGKYDERVRIKAVLEVQGVERAGHKIVAPWLDMTVEGDHSLSDQDRRTLAFQLVRDIRDSDALIYFPSWRYSVGRFFDLGAAVGAGKPVLLVGARGEYPCEHHPLIWMCSEETIVSMLQYVERCLWRGGIHDGRTAYEST